MGECTAASNLHINKTFNSSPDSTDYKLHQLKVIGYAIIGSVIVGLGILGNVINLIVLTRPNLKGVTFVYLTWLATSDLVSLLVGIPSLLRLHGIQPRSYAAAIYYAHLDIAIVNSFMATSVFLVVALTVDRYFSVCLPTRFKEVHTTRIARHCILAAYVVPFFLYLPICFQKETVISENHSNYTEYIACEHQTVTNHPAFKVYLYVKEIIVRLGPVVILALLNTAIIITFRKTVKKKKILLRSSLIGTNQLREGNKKFREEKRLVALLGGISILFFICMTPAAVLTLLNSDEKERNFGFQTFRAVANVLELANYAMNFYVYCLCSSEIRRTFLRLFICRRLPKNTHNFSNKLSFESSTRV